jgi:DNA modification methylase
VVADPFMGSGSVGVAALRLGRRFLGNDLNPEAVAIATQRLRALAGTAAAPAAGVDEAAAAQRDLFGAGLLGSATRR